MTEVELNALFNISPERVKNVYATTTIKSQDEIRRIVKIHENSRASQNG